jgi:FlaA1/EpsC-like NDP-sugar epimerase
MDAFQKNLIHTLYYRLLFKKINPRWLIFSIDMTICLLAVFIAYLLLFNFSIPSSYISEMRIGIIIILAVRFLCFISSGLYKGIIRYTGLRDIVRVILVNLAGSGFLFIVGLIYEVFFGGTFLIPHAIIVIDYILVVFLMILFRLTVKVVYTELRHLGTDPVNVAICGSKEMAVLAKRVIEADLQNNIKVVAFLSDSEWSQNKKLEGTSIYQIQQLEEVIHKYEVNQFIFASNRMKLEYGIEIAEICLRNKVKVYNITSVEAWLNGDLNLNSIRQLKIEDLINRPVISLDQKALEAQLEGKTVLVTGAAGSIGSEIVRQLTSYRLNKLVLLDQAETPMHNLEMELVIRNLPLSLEYIIGDVACQEAMEGIFQLYRPEVIYHAAAYKHVPMMENNPVEAVHNNVSGTRIVADLANKYKADKFIFISTDKAVNPTNIMGASKRIAEMYIQSLNRISDTAFITTRFGNVLGSNGSVIPLFKKQIEAGQAITVTHPEVTRFFMTIQEACQLVLEAGATGKGGEIFIFDMGKPVKIADLAKNMIRLAGLEPDVDIPIRFIGLRPGEKLYEELLHKSEDNIPTHHPKIMVAKVRELNYETVKDYMSELEKASFVQDKLQVVKVMKRIVPEFLSQNSVYETLDNAR